MLSEQRYIQVKNDDFGLSIVNMTATTKWWLNAMMVLSCLWDINKLQRSEPPRKGGSDLSVRKTRG